MFNKIKIGLKLVLVTLFTIIVYTSFASDSTTNSNLSGDIFKNINAKGIISGAKFSWLIDYDQINNVENIIIKYQKKVEKGKPWKYSPVIDAKSTSFKLEGMSSGEKYVWQIGCLKDGSDINNILKNGIPESDNLVWSGKGKYKTLRDWGLYKFLVLLGSLGLFIFGMKLMSEGLQQSAAGGLRKILSSMTRNRYLGVLSGFLVTALVQSSSATTVMTVSFVNAGLLTLLESSGVMMGANIGTTITGWLVSLFGFKISLSSYSLIFIAFGAPLMFMAKNKVKGWANAIIGFAILFMGLGFLKDAVPDLDANSGIVQFFTQFSDSPFLGRIAFVLLGTLVTIVVQSSSAAMALTLTMVLKGIIPFEVGAAMILGENIGTTITAELASLVGNVHAKRSARIHSMFNIVGVTWMIFLMPVFLNIVTWFTTSILGMAPFVDELGVTISGEGATIGLSAFHTIFNLTNVLLLIWFVPQLVKIAESTVKSKGEDDEIFKLEFISSGITQTPELSILEAKKEVVKFAELTFKMHKKSQELINELDVKKRGKLMKKIIKYEEITDSLESEIANYLGKVSTSKLTEKSSLRLRSMLSITSDLERIGDIYMQISKTVDKKTDAKLWFDQNQRDNLNELFNKVLEAYELMISNLSGNYSEINLDKSVSLEVAINELRNDLRKKHLKSMEKGDYNAQSGLIYSNIFSSIERVGDHIINVSEAASGQYLN
ncbi:MAG: Na/Pi cotransporter family protein [Bacteroidia bacterium]|nr:Na/Pi cotransporter family protein [Bacteroidia bacterium]